MAVRSDRMPLRLRPMSSDDLDAVLDIESRAYPNPWTEGIFNDCLRVGYDCWVLEEGAAVVGYGLLSIAAGEAHLLNLCIEPECQGRGLGRHLLEFLLRQAARCRARTVYLEVRPSNTPALRMYHAAGFVEAGYRKNYYPDGNGREDAVVLSLAL
jgi:ribosomal-protein-alanine N-acetyltransferase